MTGEHAGGPGSPPASPQSKPAGTATHSQSRCSKLGPPAGASRSRTAGGNTRGPGDPGSPYSAARLAKHSWQSLNAPSRLIILDAVLAGVPDKYMANTASLISALYAQADREQVPGELFRLKP